MTTVIDVSASTHPSQYASRKIIRRGIVIHATAGVDSLSWLQRYEPLASKRSSSDWLVDHDGTCNLIVPVDCYSYHSGPARWRGWQEADGTLNRSFVGIEVENLNDGHEQFTNEQYVSVAGLCRWLMTRHPISPRDICLHWECAIPDGRKTDPALFSWSIFLREMLYPSKNSPSFQAVER